MLNILKSPFIFEDSLLGKILQKICLRVWESAQSVTFIQYIIKNAYHMQGTVGY